MLYRRGPALIGEYPLPTEYERSIDRHGCRLVFDLGDHRVGRHPLRILGMRSEDTPSPHALPHNLLGQFGGFSPMPRPGNTAQWVPRPRHRDVTSIPFASWMNIPDTLRYHKEADSGDSGALPNFSPAPVDVPPARQPRPWRVAVPTSVARQRAPPRAGGSRRRPAGAPIWSSEPPAPTLRVLGG